MKKQERLYSDVVIIGAGLSGINMACQLQRQLSVYDYVVYDRADELGGAWAANTYPGCGVDIPGALYSFSWCPNPGFTNLFPSQKEILTYIQRVALENRVTHRMRFQIEWKGAQWIESSSTWRIMLQDIRTRQEFHHEAKVLISAVGGYTNPEHPDIPGLDKFEGTVLHTAQWSEVPNLCGRRVAVVGNGCSGSQVVPALIDQVSSLTHFIRTPQHYVPMRFGNYQFGKFLRFSFSSMPLVLLLFRWFVFWVLDTTLGQFYTNTEGNWKRGKQFSASQTYIKDKAPQRYWPLLTPEYELGCRRRILDHGYIESLHNPKLRLVEDPIVLAGPKGLTTQSGGKEEEHQFDLIVLATGFKFTQWKESEVIGRNGKTLKQHWDDAGGIGAYRTVAINEFPNMFYLLGPNSGSGHTSVLFMIECSVNLIIKIARPVLIGQACTVEVHKGAEVDWTGRVQSTIRKTVLSGNCSNHYTDPESGWNFFSYPFTSLSFWIGSISPAMKHWCYRKTHEMPICENE